jgi:hypothetical protein
MLSAFNSNVADGLHKPLTYSVLHETLGPSSTKKDV